MTFELPASMTETIFESTGILFGVKAAVTKDMKKFVREISPNGNPILHSKMVLDKLDVAGKMLKEYSNPLVYAADGRFENALKGFHVATKVPIIQGRMYAGTLSNPAMQYYQECDVLLVSDSANGIPTKIGQPLMGDRRAMNEASKMGIPVIAICNTNATLEDVDLAIPANNTGTMAIATIFYVLAFSFLRDPNAEVLPIETFQTVMEPLNTEEEEE